MIGDVPRRQIDKPLFQGRILDSQGAIETALEAWFHLDDHSTGFAFGHRAATDSMLHMLCNMTHMPDGWQYVFLGIHFLEAARWIIGFSFLAKAQ